MRLLKLFLLRLALVKAEEADYSSSSYCTSAKAPLAKQTPNTFLKICPEQNQFRTLGQPICGDGTTFAFYVATPPQKHDYSRRILIEFVGGGACWNAQTCEKQADYLTAPVEKFDAFVGLSCSEAAIGVDGKAINMLCGTQLGETDMSAYTTIIVPYCTQDCHSGDNTITYNNNDDAEGDGDGDGDYNTVNHAGAHNMMAVMKYIYANFDHPSHIVLTGCSAGGTALPLAYHLLHRHFSHFGARSTQVSVLADSPVFLTPSYFLQSAFDNWNTRTLVGKEIGFSHNKWKYNEKYPTKLWDYILRKGSNRDKWGFISHADDPTSQKYYQWMSGGDEEDRRRLEDIDEDVADQWASELTTAITSIQRKHSNVDAYWYDDEAAHCTFGLYYPLQQEGFSDWAGKVVKEQRLDARPQSAPFILSIASALMVVGAATYFTRRKNAPKESEDGFVKYEDDNISQTRSWNQNFHSRVSGIASRVCEYPLSYGYLMAVSMMFWIMIGRESLSHPLNNPSLGPSAISLNEYGINNPSLIVYKFQLWRILTSCFVCSGFLTYLMTVMGTWFYVRPLEKVMGTHNMAGATAFIAIGSNLLYALTTNGASCSTVSLVLGLYAFFLGIRVQRGASTCMLAANIVLTFVVTSLFFPFNSWSMMLSAIFIGGLSSFLLFSMKRDLTLKQGVDNVFELNRKRAIPVMMFFGGAAFVLVARIRRPDKLFMSPFYTGCDLKYANDIDNIASNFFGDDGGDGDRRFLDEEDGDGGQGGYCAQFCIPHIASRGISLGARKFDFEITDGTCVGLGYDEHVADKTFKYFSYSLDVEIYQNADGDDGSGDESGD